MESIPGISDHDNVLAEINTNMLKNAQKPPSIPLYRKAYWDTMKEDMTTILKTMTEMNNNDKCTVDKM